MVVVEGGCDGDDVGDVFAPETAGWMVDCLYIGVVTRKSES